MEKETTDIAVIKVQIDAIYKKQDEIMIIIKDELSRTRESYTRQVSGLEIDMARARNDQREICEERKKMIDNHCGRIRKLENGQSVNKTKLGGLILILSTIFTVIANFVWNAVSGKS